MGQGDPLSLIGILSILLAAVFYPIKLDKILPQLKLLQAVLLLLIARALDFTTFLVVTGGKATAQELNPAYQLLLQNVSHNGAAVLSQLIGLLLMGATLTCFWKAGSRRGVLTLLAAFSAFSLVGAFFNVIGGIPI